MVNGTRTRTEIDQAIHDISERSGISIAFDSPDYQELLDYLVKREVRDYMELAAILFAGLSAD